ncbi:sensor histidine kinase [Oxalobacteraceae bacterium OM1]|nr:sensor histidine kinase [Oxalobacteraceae bacterium OM1]
MIAVVITFVMRVGSFLPNLVASMCIGLTAQTLIDGTRLVLWGDNKPPKLPFLGLLGVSAPASYFIGMSLATTIFGMSPGEGFRMATQNLVGPLIVTILACAFGSYIFWNRSRIAMLEARANAIEKQALQAQLQMLQAQIEPHMLFNTLANLQGLIVVDPPRARHMLDQLIHYLRATLVSSRSQTATLAHEFSLMEAYLGLMSVRMGSRLSFTFDLPDILRETRVPPMLLQPLVENAIKHGLEPKIEGGTIEVRAHVEGATLHVDVCDDGVGIDPHADEGVGFSNIRERLQLLYGTSAELVIEALPLGGACASIRLPYKMMEDA